LTKSSSLLESKLSNKIFNLESNFKNLKDEHSSCVFNKDNNYSKFTLTAAVLSLSVLVNILLVIVWVFSIKKKNKYKSKNKIYKSKSTFNKISSCKDNSNSNKPLIIGSTADCLKNCTEQAVTEGSSGGTLMLTEDSDSEVRRSMLKENSSDDTLA